MGTLAKILYSGFWDRPLAFMVRHQGVQLYFCREFDEEVDEYQDAYKVFVLSNLSDEQIKISWGHLYQHTTRYLGLVPVNQIVFDPSFRESIDTDLVEALIKTIDVSS